MDEEMRRQLLIEGGTVDRESDGSAVDRDAHDAFVCNVRAGLGDLFDQGADVRLLIGTQTGNVDDGRQRRRWDKRG
jgi:hypothetical protein